MNYSIDNAKTFFDFPPAKEEDMPTKKKDGFFKKLFKEMQKAQEKRAKYIIENKIYWC